MTFLVTLEKSLKWVDSACLVYLEKQLQHEYDTILFQEKLPWYQKARDKWIKFGDQNTKKFHTQIVVRRKKNKIHGLTLPNGIWCNDDSILQEEAQKYFKGLFCSQIVHDQQVYNNSQVNLSTFDEQVRHNLSKSVSYEEIISALNQMNAYKAPGPDGFQGMFFKQYWHLIGGEVCSFVSQAFDIGTFNPTTTNRKVTAPPKLLKPY